MEPVFACNHTYSVAQVYADKRERCLIRRRFRTLRPALDDILLRKPCSRARRRVFG